MRKHVWVALAGLAVGVGCEKHTMVPPEGEVRHIALKDAPKPVAQKVTASYPGSSIDQIDLTRIDGFNQYTVYLTTRAGEHRIERYNEGGNTVQ